MENDSDYEQVFIVNDTDESFSENKGGSRTEYFHAESSGDGDIVSKSYVNNLTNLLGFIAIISSIAIFSCVFFSSILNLKKYEVYQFCFIAVLCVILVFFLFSGCRDSDTNHTSIEREIVQTRRKRGKPKKKFNTLQEYRASNQFRRDKAEADAKKTNEEKQSQRKSEDIELAVKALISLGFKIKRATDLVSRGLDSGIHHSDTQNLVRYALSNNNKA